MVLTVVPQDVQGGNRNLFLFRPNIIRYANVTNSILYTSTNSYLISNRHISSPEFFGLCCRDSNASTVYLCICKRCSIWRNPPICASLRQLPRQHWHPGSLPRGTCRASRSRTRRLCENKCSNGFLRPTTRQV